jgi:hypothetical protein
MTITQEQKTVKWFIQTVLINNIGQLIATGNHYLGFGPVSQGIELIGAIIEDEDIERIQRNPNSEFDTRNKSRRRFHNAIKMFSNPNYLKYCPETIIDNDYDLYQNLRCGYAHQMRPQGKIAVTTARESVEDNTKHLEIESETSKLILVSEVFYNDFKVVCETVMKMIDENKINHTKAYGNFLGLTKYE